MKEQEIQTILKDQQDILVQMNERLHRIEQQKPELIEIRDYSTELAYISGQLEGLSKDDIVPGLKESIRKQATACSNLVTAISEQRATQETLIKEIPRKIKLAIEHRITGRQRPYVVTGAVLFLTTIFSLFASIQLWRDNSELVDSDIKLRMVRLLYPKVSLEVDSTYHLNPENFQIWVKQEEERLLAIKKAEEAAMQSREEAKRAIQKLNRLKQREK